MYPYQYVYPDGSPVVGADPFVEYAAASAGVGDDPRGDYGPLFDGAASGYDPMVYPGYAPVYAGYAPMAYEEVGADGSPYYEVGADGEVYGPFVNVPEVGAPAVNLRGRIPYRGAPAPGRRVVRVPARAPVPVARPRPRVPVPVDPGAEARRTWWRQQQQRAEDATAKYGKKAIRVLGLVATADTAGAGGTGTATATPAISGPVVAILAPKTVAEDYVFTSLSVGIQPVSANGGQFSAISFSPDLNRADVDPFDGMYVIAGTPASATFTNFGALASRFRINIHVIDETSGPIHRPRQ